MQRYGVLVIIGAILFFPFLGGVHLFDWDEINFAECAREMIVSGDYLRPQIDFMPFWEKPPFFIWLQVVAMKLFGVGDYAARFPNALTGVITLCAVYYAGRRAVNEKVGTWWAILFAASWLPHLYFKSGIIDPTFNLFIFLAFLQIYLLKVGKRSGIHAMLSGLMLGMAAITKGPVAILVAGLSFVAYLVVNKGTDGYRIKHLATIILFAFVPALLWIGSATLMHGTEYGQWYLNEFIQYQIRLFSTEDSDHGGPFIYHFVVLLIGCFPASAFLFQYIGKRQERKINTHGLTQWMWILFWVVLILFSIVKTKIVHYSSLCYFPLTYLAAVQLYNLTEQGAAIKKWVRIILYSVGSILALLITILPVVGINKDKLVPFIADKFAVGNLQANVQWSYFECLWGLAYLIGLWVAIGYLKRNTGKGLLLLVGVQVMMIQVTILHFTPKIEGYTQRAAIDFFESVAGKDVYVQPLGYRSYANLFYTRKNASTNPEYIYYRTDEKGRKTPEANSHWLLYGKTDKPTYFICKINDSAEYAAKPQLKMLHSKNGFVFFKKAE